MWRPNIYIYVAFNISKEDLNLYSFVSNQGYNILNPSDNFYNDICTPFNSQNNTDVLIFLKLINKISFLKFIIILFNYIY